MIYEHDEGMTFEIIILRLSCLKRKYHKDPHRGAKCWCLDVTNVLYGTYSALGDYSDIGDYSDVVDYSDVGDYSDVEPTIGSSRSNFRTFA